MECEDSVTKGKKSGEGVAWGIAVGASGVLFEPITHSAPSSSIWRSALCLQFFSRLKAAAIEKPPIPSF